MKSQSDLENLLLSLFGNNVSELSRFIQVLPPSGSRIYLGISLQLSMANYVYEVVQQLSMHGMINIDLFVALRAIRPNRKHDIDAVWESLQREPAAAAHGRQKSSGAPGRSPDQKTSSPPPKSKVPPPHSTKAAAPPPAAPSSGPTVSGVLPLVALVGVALGAVAYTSHSTSEKRKDLYKYALDGADTARIKKALRKHGLPLGEGEDAIDVAIDHLSLDVRLLEDCLTLAQLRKFCAKHNFSTYGDKRDLSQRIADMLEAAASI